MQYKRERRFFAGLLVCLFQENMRQCNILRDKFMQSIFWEKINIIVLPQNAT